MTHGVPLSECPVSAEAVQLGEDEYLAPRPAPAPAPDLVRTRPRTGKQKSSN